MTIQHLKQYIKKWPVQSVYEIINSNVKLLTPQIQQYYYDSSLNYLKTGKRQYGITSHLMWMTQNFLNALKAIYRLQNQIKDFKVSDKIKKAYMLSRKTHGRQYQINQCNDDRLKQLRGV